MDGRTFPWTCLLVPSEPALTAFHSASRKAEGTSFSLSQRF